MITFDPPVLICPLSNVAPGSIIRVAGRIGFCGQSPEDPQQNLMLIYTESPRFRFRIPDQSITVLNFGSDLVIRPNLPSFQFEHVPAGQDSTSELLIVDGAPKIVMHAEGGSTRMLDLNSGKTGPAARNIASAFTIWEVGIELSFGRFFPLMSLSE